MLWLFCVCEKGSPPIVTYTQQAEYYAMKNIGM